MRMRAYNMRLAAVMACVCLVGAFCPALSYAATYTWTNNAVGTQDWATAGNWDGSGVFVSGAANEVRFFPDTSTLLNPTVGTLTITNIPSALSMNTLTLRGRGPNGANVSYVILGDSASTWTIGDGTTSMVNLESTKGGGHADTDDLRYTIAANLDLNQPTTTFTGNGINYSGYTFAGNISESGAGYGITKSGSSWLTLSGVNTYSGSTTVSGGRLRLLNSESLPGGIGNAGGTSALTLSGGVLELKGVNFLRNLGTGSDQWQITSGSSGLCAFESPVFVCVSNDAAMEVVWGSASFAPSTLILNEASSAEALLTLENSIDLNGSTRTVQVNAEMARIAGDIKGTGSLTKSGGGTLELLGTNTYTGDTTISGGILSGGPDNDLGAGAGITFSGGTLRINGTSATNIASLGYGLTFSSSTGFDIADENNNFTVDQVLNQGGGQFYKRGPGTLVLNEANTFTGYNYIYEGTLVLDYTTQDNAKLANNRLYFYGGEIVLRGGSYNETVSQTYLTTYTSSYISRDGGSATIDLKDIGFGDGSVLGISEDSIATTTEPLVNGIIYNGYVTAGSHFATTNASGEIVAFSGYNVFTNGQSGGNFSSISEWRGGGSIGGTVDGDAMRIVNTGNSDVLNTSGSGLRCDNVASHIYAGGFDNKFTITGTGGLRTQNGNQRMILNVYTGVLTVNAPLTSGGGATLAKAGKGTLVVPYANSYSSSTYVQDGILRLANDSAAGTSGGGIIVRPGAALELTNSINIGTESLTLAGSGISNGGALRSLAGDNVCAGGITLAGNGTRVNADSGTLTLVGDITGASKTVTFGGAGNITLSNTTVTATSVTKDGTGKLSAIIDDSSRSQWVCGSASLNDSTLGMTFNISPSETVPLIKVMGDLSFAGTPTIEIVADPADLTTGTLYPLIEVAGRAPSTRPTLVGGKGSLKWGGSGSRTLYLDTSALGTILIIR